MTWLVKHIEASIGMTLEEYFASATSSQKSMSKMAKDLGVTPKTLKKYLGKYGYERSRPQWQKAEAA